jgi:iron complex outermembrane receptor protein
MANQTYKATAIAAGIAVALGTAPASFAQDDTIEEVVVTGSHIRRTGFEGRAPIQIVDAEEIAQLGINQPVEVLKDLTANSGSQLYNETNAVAGSAMFNIRNLGLGSTLTLVNGRRAGVAAVADATGTDFVDINQFPVAMFERIEVLTDGASATYGSQAVSGVVNLITRKGFEGFELSGGFSSSEIETYDLNIVAGSQFDNGGFNLYATYYNQDRQDRSDFDWMHDRLIGDSVIGDISRSRFLSSTGSPGSYRLATLNAAGEAVDVAGFVQSPDADCEAAGGVLLSPTDTSCRYHFVDQVSVISAEERVQVFTEFDWSFNDELRYYAEASWSHNVVRRSDGGSTFNTGSAEGGGFTIDGDHPFNFFIEDPAIPGALQWIGPEAWDPAIHTGATLRAIARPFGADVNHNELTEDIRRQTDYVRFVNGLEYDFDNSWFIDASLTYSNATRVSDGAHGYRSDIFQELVRAGDWNPFGTRVSNPTLVSPKDGVSVAGNDQIIEDKFDQRNVDTARAREVVVDVVASGELFELGGNTVSAAIGGQYRDVTVESVPDSLGAAGESNEESTENFVSGSQDVTAIFGELIVPIGDMVEVQLAVRQEDYGGSIGSTTDPKVSFEFRPLDWVGFRGSFGTSFQAPTVRQTAEASASAFIDDPASPTGPGNSLVCVSTGLNNNIAVAVIGAPDLKPQESENYNLGIVFDTDFGLRARVDYWNFDYTDLIAQDATPQAIVNNDCAQPPVGDGIPNDPRVIRDAGGQLRQVNTQFTNIGRVETDGIDLAVDYTMDIGNSTLIFDTSWTQVFKFDVDRDGDGSTEFDGAGSRNFSNNFSTMPELRGNFGVTWLMGNHAANITARYIDSYENDQTTGPGTPAPGVRKLGATIDSWTTIDAQYSITLPGLITEGDTVLTVGINNLTDEDPPGVVRCLTNDLTTGACTANRPLQNPSTGIFDGFDRPGYDDRAGHDIRGQIIYLRFVQDF